MLWAVADMLEIQRSTQLRQAFLDFFAERGHERVASGVYFLRLVAEGVPQTRKLIKTR